MFRSQWLLTFTKPVFLLRKVFVAKFVVNTLSEKKICYIPKYYISLHRDVAQDLICITSTYIYSKILMIIF